jgi:hypothetical protein
MTGLCFASHGTAAFPLEESSGTLNLFIPCPPSASSPYNPVLSSLCGALAIKSADMVVAGELVLVEHGELDLEGALVMRARGRGSSRPRGGLGSVGLRTCGRLFAEGEDYEGVHVLACACHYNQNVGQLVACKG